MDKLSKRRLAENEVIFRRVNESVQKFIEEDGAKGPQTVLSFYCECSKPECRERIALSAEDYKKLHENKRQFVVLVGHDIPEIEKIVRKEKNFSLVEKYGDPPGTDEIELALKNINI